MIKRRKAVPKPFRKQGLSEETGIKPHTEIARKEAEEEEDENGEEDSEKSVDITQDGFFESDGSVIPKAGVVLAPVSDDGVRQLIIKAGCWGMGIVLFIAFAFPVACYFGNIYCMANLEQKQCTEMLSSTISVYKETFMPIITIISSILSSAVTYYFTSKK